MERDVRVVGHLRLHAHQAFDHLERGSGRPFEQALAREQRAVELSRGEDLGHGADDMGGRQLWANVNCGWVGELGAPSRASRRLSSCFP